MNSAQIFDGNPWEAKVQDGKTSKLPAWKEAVDRFMEQGFKPGEPILHSWFYAAFGLLMPQQCGSIHAAQQSQLRYLANMDGLKSALCSDSEK